MSRSLRALLCVGLVVSFAMYVESRSHGAKATKPLAAAAAAAAAASAPASASAPAAAAVGSMVSLESSPSSRNSRRPINRHMIMMNMDPFRSSKRRVPNGPDPIHNRGEGKSGRPPGRA